MVGQRPGWYLTETAVFLDDGRPCFCSTWSCAVRTGGRYCLWFMVAAWKAAAVTLTPGAIGREGEGGWQDSSSPWHCSRRRRCASSGHAPGVDRRLPLFVRRGARPADDGPVDQPREVRGPRS